MLILESEFQGFFCCCLFLFCFDFFFLTLYLNNTMLMKSRQNQGPEERGERLGSPSKKKKGHIFPLPFPSERKYWERILKYPCQPEPLEDVPNSGPSTTPGEGGISRPHLHTHKHKCTAPQRCCPLGPAALPVGKPKPGSCRFQLRLGHAVLLKKACWLRGVLCFQSMGKRRGEGAMLRLELAKFHWLEFSRSYEWV